MKVLLDTHALLWIATRHPSMSSAAAQVIINPANDAFVSAVSFYEIELKRRRGHMPANLPYDMQGICVAEGFTLVDVTPADARDAALLPEHHRDQWDRIMVAQALRRGMTIATKDRIFPDYGVPVIW